MLGRRERKKQEVRERIRQAAVELFREKGYEVTTVEEIAERADVAKGTFFNYFARKDALLEALAEGMLNQLEETLGPPESWSGTGQEQLLRLFEALAEFASQDRELSKVMMIENMRNFWLRSDEDPIEQEFRELTRSVLMRARERGEYREDADTDAAASLLEAAFHMTIVEWMRRDRPFGWYQDQLAAQFGIVFRGLSVCAPAGEGKSW